MQHHIQEHPDLVEALFRWCCAIAGMGHREYDLKPIPGHHPGKERDL